MRSGVHNLFRRFKLGLFAIFDSNFAKNCGATLQRMWELCSVSERAITSEKRWKPRKNRAINGNGNDNACSNYATLERTVLRTQSVTNKKHHIFAATADAHCAIFTKLCMVVELVVPIKKCVIHFSIIFVGAKIWRFYRRDRRAPASAWPCKISRQSVQRAGNAAPKYQKFPLFGKEGDSFDRFRKFLEV